MTIENLPEIVKREILYIKLNEPEAVEERKTTTSRLVSMLGVNFANDQDKSLAISEMGTFIRGYNLTSPEVIEAYRMALRKELQNMKGEIINIYPNLSLITAGEVLNAYQEFKILDKAHTEGTKTLKKQLGLVKELPPVKPDRAKFLEFLYEEMIDRKKAFVAFTLYDDLEQAGKIPVGDDVKKRLYNRLLDKHKSGMLTEMKRRTGKPEKVCAEDLMGMFNTGDLKTVIVRKCQTIIVCNYLKHHLVDFETFKNAING